MESHNDPLHFLPMKKWGELQTAFRSDGPRSISGYNALEVQRRLVEDGHGYGFKVFCPYGDIWNGMVAINEKGPAYEVVLLCPKDDTKILEEAIRKTKQIDWSRSAIMIPVAPPSIIEMVQRIAQDFGKNFDSIDLYRYTLDNNKPKFEISLAPELQFKPLTLDHVELVESKWPHRNVCAGSMWVFEHLTKAKFGYGLFNDDQLLCWMFVDHLGHFSHLFTLEEHRGNGYGEIIVKLYSNMIKEEKRDVYCGIAKGNEMSSKLFTKLGFEVQGFMARCLLTSKIEVELNKHSSQ